MQKSGPKKNAATKNEINIRTELHVWLKATVLHFSLSHNVSGRCIMLLFGGSVHWMRNVLIPSINHSDIYGEIDKQKSEWADSAAHTHTFLCIWSLMSRTAFTFITMDT